MPTPRRSGSLLPFMLVVATLLSLPAAADDAKVGVRGGYYTDIEEPFIGAELLLKVAPRFYFNPNAEYVFLNNAKYFTWNADFHYDFHSRGSSFAWLGAGLAVTTFNPRGPNNSNNDVAANILAGVGVQTGGLIPYFQAKVIAKDETEFVLAFGLRF